VRSLKVVIFSLIALMSVSAMAEQKIAVLDFAQAIFKSDLAVKRIEALKSESGLATMQAEYDAKISDVKSLQKDAETNSMTWSADQSAAAQKKMEYLRADLELIGRKIQAEQKAVQQSILQEIQPVASKELESLLKAEGINILIRSDAVVWQDGDSDITNKLITRLNKATAKK
jgi:outer membrane protein